MEIGAGVGANLDYVPAGSRLVAIEPNLAMHPGLRERADERGVGPVIVDTRLVDRRRLGDGGKNELRKERQQQRQNQARLTAAVAEL